MASIIDIAHLAGVSKSTVSRVVSNNGYVAPKTRSKIEKVMEQLKFQPSMFAKGMRTNRSHSIGILFPDLTNPFFAEWYVVVDQISKAHGYLNYICITDPKGETEEQRIDDLLARSIDGIILFSYRKDEEFLQKLREISKKVAVVCCNSMYSGQGLSCVYANGSQGTFDAVQHLFQTGKKRIAYIKGITEYRSLNNRFSGYQNAFIANGLAIDNSLIYEGNLTIESGYRAAETFMKLETPPDAIVAGTDLMAIGVLDYLRKNNIRVPEDVAVFGYANLHIAQNSLPPLSTVATPISEMAESAINMVIELMNGKHETPVEKVFKCELKIRESSAAIL